MVNDNLSKEDKEEIILDTFFILWKNYKENYNINSLSSYMAGITKNLVREKLKISKRNINIDQFSNLIENNTIEIYSDERKDINELYKSIKKLKEIDIEIINMFYYSNKSIKDIAKRLKISETNVKTRLYRIRNKLKQKLKKEDFKI